MIAWGGTDGANYFSTGGRYDPSSDSWMPLSMADCPSGRASHTAVWTGTEMIVWGGGSTAYLNTGGRYSPGAPLQPMAGNNGPVCAGQTLSLTASAISGAAYSWTGPNGFASSLQNPGIFNAAMEASGTYSVTATVNGCASPAGTTEAAVHICLPPVGSGKAGTMAALFNKDPGIPNLIDVTYDAIHCSAQVAVILYGNIGSNAGYVGCALNNAGNLGAAIVDGTSLENVWFNILWANGTTAGHPGYAFNGAQEVPRLWTASGFCGMTSDDSGYGSCP